MPLDAYINCTYVNTVETNPAYVIQTQIFRFTWTFPPPLDNDFEWVITGIIASTIIYGFNVLFGAMCIIALINGRRKGDGHRRLFVLCVYLIAMLALATWSVVHSNGAMVVLARESNIVRNSPLRYACDNFDSTHLADFFNNGQTLYTTVVPNSVPATIWGADGILIWRCSVLYQALSRTKRRIIYGVLALVGACSLASGLYLIVKSLIGGFDIGSDDIGLEASQFILPSTIAVNLLVAGLIAARLLYAHHLLVASAANTDAPLKIESPYIVALRICVESSLIILVWAILSMITTKMMYGPGAGAAAHIIDRYSYPAGLLIPITIFPQICVFSPFLIVYRVARRRANDPVAAWESNLTRRSIAFHHSEIEAESGTFLSD